MHQNISEFVRQRISSFEDLPAFILKKDQARTSVSFKDFWQLVDRYAEIFKTVYKSQAFKIGLCGENRLEWCLLACAAWKANGTVVPLMHIATDEEIRNIIKAADLDILFISPNLNKTSTFPVPAQVSMDLVTLEAELAAMHLKAKSTSTEKVAVLIFTSGTTGNPKGVMLSHENIITNMLDTVDLLPGHRGDRLVSILPLAHMFELVAGFLIAHLKGVCISYPDSLKPEDVLKEMRIHKASWLVAVPQFFEIVDRTIQEKLRSLPPSVQNICRLLAPLTSRSPRLAKMVYRKVHEVFGSHMKFFVSGGAKLDPEIMQRFQNLGIEMMQGYGLTETSPIVSFTTPRAQKYASVGKAVKSVDIDIRDGEICVKGTSVFNGYFQNPEATNQVLREGWFHTGDVGHVDGDGFLFITGRKKDIIVTPNGKNVYPEELEECLKASSLFLEVAVLGINKGHGESVHAVVVCKPNVLNDPKLRTLVHEEMTSLTAGLSDYKHIQNFSISAEELPKTATRKVKKHLLKEMILKNQLVSPQSSTTIRTPLQATSKKQSWLEAKLKEVTKQDEIWLEAQLKTDLGIDSLTFMEIIGAAESHWQIRIPDEEFAQIQSVEDLVNILSKTPETQLLEARPTVFDFRKNTGLFFRALRVFVHALLIRPVLRVYFRFYKVGPAFTAPQQQFVITPNHASHLDIISILSALPLRQLNKTFAVAADDYFFKNFFRALFVRLVFNAVPFDRKLRADLSFKVCEDILKSGGSLIIFPEGTRSPTGELAAFKPGVGRLLASQPYLALPAYIEGAHSAFPKGSRFPKPKSVGVYFGRPENFSNLESSLEGYQKVSQKLYSSVESLKIQNSKTESFVSSPSAS